MDSTSFQIALFKGDGIGIDVSEATFAVIDAARRHYGGFSLHVDDYPGGAAYYRENGRDLPQGAEEAVMRADAIFVGAIGLPTVRHPDGTEIAPHLRFRDVLQLYAGVRPVKAYPNTPQRLSDARAAGIDLIVLRESTEGLFYSAATNKLDIACNDDEVQDILRITRKTTEKLHDFAFDFARKRKENGGKGLVTCVDKANVFRSMAFFRRIFDERAERHPDVQTGYRYIDALALDLVRRPWEFDVLVMENMFGDIISDLAAGLVGGMGMASCGEIGAEHGLFQPAHGSAPDIMGQDSANPIASILSGALMLHYLGDKSGRKEAEKAALAIERAVEAGFAQGRLRPIEFGGDMGTKAVMAEIIDLIG